ncbi:MAG: hypothetical protein R2881_09405 [Eubacteriales bacterium]
MTTGSAPAAGLLLALYPANIVHLRVATRAANRGAVCAVIRAVCHTRFLRARRGKAMLFAALGRTHIGCVRGCAHVGMGSGARVWRFWAVLLLSSFRIEKEPLRLLLLALAFAVVFFSLRAIVLNPSARGMLDGNLLR